ncbi:MAG: hypothetical protein AAF219_03465 [Myxococcota bacterium]
MYDKTDPRSSLRPQTSALAVWQTGLIAEPQAARFYDSLPQLSEESRRTWLHRGMNFIVEYSVAAPNCTFFRCEQSDEYCVVLPDSSATITWNGNVRDVPAGSIAFIPPGVSQVTVHDGGDVVRVFTSRSTDLAAACANSHAYDRGRTHIPPFVEWPTPKDGWKIRHYPLEIEPEPGRFGRIYRCTTLMVNVLYPFDGPRDPSKMSPHHHDDFEQGSLALAGDFTHHLRWPWTTNMADWRADEAFDMRAPSLLVIPPPVIHTTRATGPGRNRLVDIFAPPRSDFSEREGWVLNAGDYPLPARTNV